MKKNNISFYRHETNSHNHWKFKTLRRQYKWEGEGKFWALNNMIADSDNCELDLSLEEKKMEVAADLDFSVEELDSFIEFLTNKCKLLKSTSTGSLTTEKVQEVFAGVDEKRQRQREWKKERSTEKTRKSTTKSKKSTETFDNSPPVDDEKQQSKVKKSKEENSKVKRVNSLVVSDETTRAQGELKKNYSALVEGFAGRPKPECWEELKTFITDKKPEFIEPYIDAWNMFADTYKLECVKLITDERRRKFATRIREPAFDFLALLKEIKISKFLQGDSQSGWKVDFNYLIHSEANYVKILEKKFSS